MLVQNINKRRRAVANHMGFAGIVNLPKHVLASYITLVGLVGFNKLVRMESAVHLAKLLLPAVWGRQVIGNHLRFREEKEKQEAYKIH